MHQHSQSLDRHLHAGAKAPGRGQQDFFYLRGVAVHAGFHTHRLAQNSGWLKHLGISGSTSKPIFASQS